MGVIVSWEVPGPMIPVPEVSIQSQNVVGAVVIPNDISYVMTTTVHPGFTKAITWVQLNNQIESK